jgi:copper chaperone NosL
MTRRRFLQLALTGAAGVGAAPALWALATRPSSESGPPPIAYGRDRCDAAARRGGAVYRFDDVGCLVRHSGAALAGGAAGFVHDAATESWLEAGRAWYARSPKIRTPMNYGLAAYADDNTARQVHPDATVLAFDALLAALAKEQ